MDEALTARIGLANPKYAQNVGAAVRAAACYGASSVWYTGDRIPDVSTKDERLPRELRMKAYQGVGVRHLEYLFDMLVDKETVPVAVELLPGSESLVDFVHPDNAYYLFGPEDGDLSPMYRRRCHKFVHVPTVDGMCMNLAATVNVVLYDRMAKQ